MRSAEIPCKFVHVRFGDLPVTPTVVLRAVTPMWLRADRSGWLSGTSPLPAKPGGPSTATANGLEVTDADGRTASVPASGFRG
jgi:hypothetical protein